MIDTVSYVNNFNQKIVFGDKVLLVTGSREPNIRLGIFRGMVNGKAKVEVQGRKYVYDKSTGSGRWEDNRCITTLQRNRIYKLAE